MSLAMDTRAPAMGDNRGPAFTLADTLAERHADALAEVDDIADRANSLPKTIKDEVQLGRVGDVVKAARGLATKLDTLRKAEVEPHLKGQRETNAFFATFADRLKRIGDTLGDRATDYQRAVVAEARRKADEEAAKLRAAEDAAREKAQAAHEAGKSDAAVQKHLDAADLSAERAARAEKVAEASAADLTRSRSSTGTVATTRTAWAFEITDFSKVPLEMLRPYLPRADIEKAVRSFVKNNQDAVQLGGVRIFQDTKAAFR